MFVDIVNKIQGEVDRAINRGRKSAYVMSLDLEGVSISMLKKEFEDNGFSFEYNRICVNCSKAKYDIILTWS